jgi:hypothetical protein
MCKIIEKLQSIHTLAAFNSLRDEIIQDLKNDPNLAPRDRMRLPAILNRENETWHYRVQLVVNLLIDPNSGNGGFIVENHEPQYTQEDMTLFLDRILARHGFGSHRLWSAAELELAEHERKFIDGYPANAPGNGTPIEGVFALLAEAQHVGETYSEGEVWASIEAMPWSQNARWAWFADGDSKQSHRKCVANGASRYGMRLAPQGAGQFFLRTVLLQFGLSKIQWSNYLKDYMPPTPDSVGAQILFNLDGGNDCQSLSFAETWEAMRKVMLGRVSANEAERLMEESAWIRHEWIPDLIEAYQMERKTVTEDWEDGDADACILSEATLIWIGNTPHFKWAVNVEALNEKCPESCNQIDLTGPCGWIGRIRREGVGWRRLSGLGIKDDLSFQIPADSIIESEVGFEISNSNSEFHVTETSTIYPGSDDVTRYNAAGQRHSNAWRKQLPRGEEFSLCVPDRALVTPEPSKVCRLEKLGVSLVHFREGWTDRIQISIEDEVLWDTEILIAPSKKLPPDLRSFNVFLVVNTINQNTVRGQLKVGAQPVSVRISSDKRELLDLEKRNAISFGPDERPLSELWSGSKVRLKIQAPDGRNHGITKNWEVIMRGVDGSIPLFLARKLDGTVVSLKSDRPVETMQQFLSLKIKMIAKEEVSGALLLQNGFPVGTINRDAKSAPNCLGRKIPFYTETFRADGDAITRGPLMDGVVERGIIESVTKFENDGSSFSVILTHPVEPTRDIQDDGKHHKILILSQTSKEPGNRLRTTVVEGASICADEANGSEWRLQIGDVIGNVLGVAVCYGNTLLGCWTKGGEGAAQNALEAEDLTKEEVLLLADYLRWFHFPFFDRHLIDAVCRFFSRHAPEVLHRWETAKAIIWNNHRITVPIAEPEWDRVVRALVMETNHFLQAPINYRGIAELVKACDTDNEKIDCICAFLSQAPASAVELKQIGIRLGLGYMFSGTVSNDHPAIQRFDKIFLSSIKKMGEASNREWYWKYRNDPETCRRDFINMLNEHDAMNVSSDHELQNNLDPDWSELRAEYAKLEKRKGNNVELIELWRNPSGRVNAALANGVLQAQGKKLDGAPLRELNYLMSFPAFCRLLARKILSPSLTIPEP